MQMPNVAEIVRQKINTAMTKAGIDTEVKPQAAANVSLNRTGKHVYGGTVSPKTIAHRRARGRMAKASRKANR